MKKPDILLSGSSKEIKYLIVIQVNRTIKADASDKK
jgi:hypothetical protein